MNVDKEFAFGIRDVWTFKPEAACMVGSAMYSESPQDVDILVLFSGQSLSAAVAPFCDKDWALCGQDYGDDGSQFKAVRKGVLNLLITCDPAWYANFKLAAEVCAVLKLETRQKRIAVHRLIRDEWSMEQARDELENT